MVSPAVAAAVAAATAAANALAPKQLLSREPQTNNASSDQQTHAGAEAELTFDEQLRPMFSPLRQHRPHGVGDAAVMQGGFVAYIFPLSSEQTCLKILLEVKALHCLLL
jgi:hypothetical protein